MTAAALNFIKCRFCEWKTRKWGRGSTPAKAFARLRDHLVEEHGGQHEEIHLACQKLDEKNDRNEYSEN